jgi:uncharacterized protein YdeI (YjbR/CyaY-like superfamily)
LWVGFHRKGTGLPSITWPESVDQALCYGWIDGIRKRIDDTSYMIRFTPRRADSTWSAVNLRRIAALMEDDLVRPAGRRALEARKPDRSGLYSYEQRKRARFSAEYLRRFQASRKAWSYWEGQPPGYRITATFWVMSAKREATRDRRLATLIQDSAADRRIAPLRRA